ncbi:hypothetical protein [Aeromonas enteropelogenes]|uniref:hypothetical protein n=1 Tax=Aeromonas enteropelogenes TaxID=29489 RepID=UPI003BA2A405
MKSLANELIEHFLFEKIMESLGDLERLSNLCTSREFYFVTEIEREYQLDQRDFELSSLIEIWNELYSSIKKLNNKEIDFISYFSSKFNIQFKDSFLLFGTILKHQNYIRKELDQADIVRFNKYCDSLAKHVSHFRMNFIHYALAKEQESFFNKSDIISKGNIKFTKSGKIDNSIYADQNVFSKLIDNDSKISYIKRNGINLVYSSYTIEDSLNKNPIFMPEYLEKISNLTNGNMVGYMDDGLNYVNESIFDTYSRTSSYRNLTKNYENTVFLNKYKDYFLYENLRKNSEISNIIYRDVTGFFSNEKKLQFKGYFDIVSRFSQYEDIDTFVKTGKLPEVINVRDTINNLNELLDFINYETESLSFNNKAKIYSSFRDGQHLQHAYICDYFATDDKKLASRAKLIFGLVGVNTKVISMNEMMNIK